MLTKQQQIAFICTCQDLNIKAEDALTLLRMTFGIDILIQMTEVLKMTGTELVTNCCGATVFGETNFCKKCGEQAEMVIAE